MLTLGKRGGAVGCARGSQELDEGGHDADRDDHHGAETDGQAHFGFANVAAAGRAQSVGSTLQVRAYTPGLMAP